MRQNHLSIHSENILPIIKKWLYSDKDIFLRELVSNATDALNKVKILRDQGEIEASDSEAKISIDIDKKNKTITISDTGIGMTESEVEKYIAQIAFSGAEEFVAKYKSETEKDPIIGHFGLGFYSSYMVASLVEIETLSYLPESTPVHWSCDGGSSYEIGAGKRKERGTSIILHVDEANQEYLEEAKLRSLLHRNCSFMPFPIEINGKGIGNRSPLWMKSPVECKEADYLEFHRFLFPLDPDPIFWVHLNVDYPFHLKGILYFPKIHQRFDSQKGAIQLFCNRVFVSDNCKEIFPDYLTVLRGAIDSPDIPLNVSRSYLQVDPHVRDLSRHIAKKIGDKLNHLYKNERQKYIDSWPDIEMFLKLGILQDDKFYDRVKEYLIWKNSEGEWTTVPEYLERAKEKKVYYAHSERATSLQQLYREKKIEILLASSPIDTPLIQALEAKLEISFQRIDGALEEALLDPSREKSLLDADGKTESSKIAQFIRSSLHLDHIEVEAKSLASDQLTGLILLDERQRRYRDYMALTQTKSEVPVDKKTFVVNTNHKLVQLIGKLQNKQPEIAEDMARGLYDLACLAQRELEPTDIEQVVSRQTQMLEKLSSLLV